MEVPFASEIAD